MHNGRCALSHRPMYRQMLTQEHHKTWWAGGLASCLASQFTCMALCMPVQPGIAGWALSWLAPAAGVSACIQASQACNRLSMAIVYMPGPEGLPSSRKPAKQAGRLQHTACSECRNWPCLVCAAAKANAYARATAGARVGAANCLCWQKCLECGLSKHLHGTLHICAAWMGRGGTPSAGNGWWSAHLVLGQVLQACMHEPECYFQAARVL